MRGTRSIARTTLILLPLQVAARAVEALLPVVLALWFGRNEGTDVYYLVWAIFALVGSVVFSAFQDSAVVPVLVEASLHEAKEVPRIRGSLLAHTLVAGGGFVVITGAATAAWLSVRYAGHARALALAMVVPFSAYLVALSVKTLLASILAAEHRYAAMPVAAAASAATTLAVIAVGRAGLSVVAIPCGSLAGELVAVGALALAARRARLEISPTMARPEAVRRIARLVASEVGGNAITRVNPVVDQLMAGWLAVVGGGTMLKLAGDVAMVPTSLLQAALFPVLLTHLSDRFAAKQLSELRATAYRALAVVVVLLLGATVLLWAVRLPLLRLAFAHGAMDEAGVRRMARLLPYHLLGLAPFGALLVLARAHVAAQNSGIMTAMGVLNAALNVTLNFLLMKPLGLEGIALSTSCTYAIVALVFAARFESRLASSARAAAGRS